MTDKNILKEVKKWQELLSLNEWLFLIQPIKNSSVSDCGELAQCYIHEDSMSASIVIAVDLPDDEIRKSIKHELLHVALYDLRSVFNDASELLGKESQTALGGRYGKCEEKTVIRLERLIDKFLPDDEKTVEASQS